MDNMKNKLLYMVQIRTRTCFQVLYQTCSVVVGNLQLASQVSRLSENAKSITIPFMYSLQKLMKSQFTIIYFRLFRLVHVHQVVNQNVYYRRRFSRRKAMAVNTDQSHVKVIHEITTRWRNGTVCKPIGSVNWRSNNGINQQ